MATSAKPRAVPPNLTGTKKTSPAAGKTTALATTKGKTSTQTPAQPTRGPGMGRFFLGMMLYVFASYVVQILLYVLDGKVFHNKLTATYLFTLPILGRINIMALIFIPFLVILLWALYKFKILPSQAELRAQAQNQAAARGTAIGRNAPAKNAAVAPAPTGWRALFAPRPAAPVVPAKGNNATKSSTVRAATTTGKTAVTSKTGSTATSTVGKTTTGKLATSTVGNGKPGVKKTSVAREALAENDEIYHQVRAQLRSQTRKHRKH
jgi:hypothetical protein